MLLEKIKLIDQPYFSVEEAQEYGISARMLKYYADKGDLVRVSQGVYGVPSRMGIDLESIIMEKIKAIPQGVIGLKTALRYYDLSDEGYGLIDVIVPLSNVPKAKIDDIRLYRVKDRLLKIGVDTNAGFPITNVERTIIDLMRTGETLSLVIDVFKNAQIKNIPVSLSNLKKLARIFRVKLKMDQFLKAVL